ATLLSGCGMSGGKIPSDTYYRLRADESAVVGNVTPWTDGTLRVRSFASDDVHRERAILFEDESGVEVRQHRYHYWSDSPSRMLQLLTARQLRASGVAGHVITDSDPAELEVRGHVHRFTRRDDRVTVELELQLYDVANSRSLFHRDYSEQVEAAGSGLSAAAAAFSEASNRIIRQFIVEARN
ncbi:MAG: membrane integrity-associated transporter subunit PqiC, partial [Gammaproteobacteria bacterium]|nr:membrane integrity-associated transporter subunit PqiC [Gammaproteobacteria bacterium]